MFSISEQTCAATKGFAGARAAAPSLLSLFRGQPLETIEAGAAILWQGDAAAHVFAVEEGVLRVFRILGDGRRVITGFLYPGAILGVSLRDRYLYNAEAVTAAKIRRFARSRLQDAIAQAPELRPQLFARLCDDMEAAQDQMVLLARKSAEERVCSFLLVIARRMRCDRQAEAIIEIPMSRLDMADHLGMTVETVSRTMSRLASRGVITPAGRRGVTIRQYERLLRLLRAKAMARTISDADGHSIRPTGRLAELTADEVCVTDAIKPQVIGTQGLDEIARVMDSANVIIHGLRRSYQPLDRGLRTAVWMDQTGGRRSCRS